MSKISLIPNYDKSQTIFAVNSCCPTFKSFMVQESRSMGLRQCILLAYRNFCGALDWFSLSVGGVGVSRGGVEFVPVDAGPVCGRDAVVRFGRRCLIALPQGVGDE